MPGICIDGADRDKQKILLDIRTKKRKESYQIDSDFTGTVLLRFRFGGLAGVEKQENVRIVEKLK